MKIINLNTILKTLFAFFFVFTLFIGGQAKAEARPSASNFMQYIGALGPIAFGQSGGAFLPVSVLGAMKNGQVSAIMQFVLMTHMMNGCVVDAVKRGKPGQREPYVVANAKFTYGICRIKKCFQQGMLIATISGLSSNPAAGGGDAGEQQANQAQGMALAQAFKKDPSCDGQDKQNGGMDLMLLAMFMQK